MTFSHDHGPGSVAEEGGCLAILVIHDGGYHLAGHHQDPAVEPRRHELDRGHQTVKEPGAGGLEIEGRGLAVRSLAWTPIEGSAPAASLHVAAFDAGGAHPVTVASARIRDRLLAVARLADDAVAALPDAGVAVAADCVASALEEIDAATGADTRETVLDAVFSRFCIGK